MNKAINDSTVCKFPGRCPNHPVKNNEAPQVLSDTVAAQLDTAIIIDQTQTLISEAPKPVKIIMPIFDTIKPVNVSLLSEQTYTPVITQSVSKAPEIEKPMNIDLLCNSVVFGFALFLTARYVVTSSAAWVAMFKELKSLA